MKAPRNLIPIFFLIVLKAQVYTPADPLYLLVLEQRTFFDASMSKQSLLIRPFFNSTKSTWSVRVRNEHYFNNNAPNQENMDVRYFGKGYGWFLGLNVSYWGQYIAFSFEPYWLKNDNRPINTIERPRPYTHLNDVRFDDNSPFVRSGFREAQFYLHYKSLGIGLSNASLWWGPGIHNTLSMTNNTVGFPHFMLGTLKEIRWKKIGINGRYTFARMNEEKGYRATYFTALTGTMTIYSNPIITLGFSRNYMTGGVDVGVPWHAKDAAKIVFEGVFIENLKKKQYSINGHDPWDQTLSTYIVLDFPESRLKLFIEAGVNDNRQNILDLRSEPDHATASVIGFRKYGFFSNPDLLLGFEYTNLVRGKFHIFRGTPNWYERPHYDDWSYENRRWAAHSGSDSDDFLIYFGYLKQNHWALIPGFSYERHGLTYSRPSEVKLEFRLDFRYFFHGLNFNVYFENQYEEHLGFNRDNIYIHELTGVRRTKTLYFGLQKVFNISK